MYLRCSRKLEEDITNNKVVDADVKVKAHHLAAELDKAALYLYYEAPSALASRRARLLSSSASSSSSYFLDPSSLPSSLEEAYRLQYEKETAKKKQQQEEEVAAKNSYGFKQEEDEEIKIRRLSKDRKRTRIRHQSP
jgi:hypothetical protein